MRVSNSDISIHSHISDRLRSGISIVNVFEFITRFNQIIKNSKFLLDLDLSNTNATDKEWHTHRFTNESVIAFYDANVLKWKRSIDTFYFPDMHTFAIDWRK